MIYVILIKNISILENHLGIIHGQEWSCSLVAGLYACGICDFEFKNVSILEDHLEIGHIQKEALCLYSCEICDFEFRNMWKLWFWIQKHVEFVILKSKWVSILEYHLWIRHIKKKSLWWRGKDRKLNFIGKRQHFYCLNCVYSRPPATNIVKFHDKQ